MGALDGKIELTSLIYRPCLADGEKALFHRWFDDELVTLKFAVICPAEVRAAVSRDWAENHMLPPNVDVETTKMLRGLVEMENGKMRSVSPDKIQFLDTGDKMQEQGLSFYDEWIEHVKGETEHERK